MRVIKLSNRLGTVAGFIEKGASVVDVGTDHGLLPVYLAQNGLARRIVASDISDRSLSAAHRSAYKHGVADRIAFVAAPGLAGAKEAEIDTAVIAGVGGETIIDILADAPWVIDRSVRLILQPQTKINRLCRWLRDSGYTILDAELARDSGRFYTIMLAVAGACASDLPPEMELASILAGRRDPLFAEYIDRLISQTNRALRGLEKSGGLSEELPRMKKKLKELYLFRGVSGNLGFCSSTKIE